MNALLTMPIATDHGEKTISVYCCDILDFDEPIDILTTSAFQRSYDPTPGTLFGTLKSAGISVRELAVSPMIDLRRLCNIWLSHSIAYPNIQRIGCVELSSLYGEDLDVAKKETAMLNSIKAYFQMLDIAATYGIPMDTVTLPLLGAGNQKISTNLTLIPVINECVAFLKRCHRVRRICFIERNPAKANLICSALENSYIVRLAQNGQESSNAAPSVSRKTVFISYSSADKAAADQLCKLLESRDIQVWYAPRDVRGPYAAAIAEAIMDATHFVVLLSRSSLRSEHVLNEIDLAFQKLPGGIAFKPLRLDEAPLPPAFNYYLSRQHWFEAYHLPLSRHLEDFASQLAFE